MRSSSQWGTQGNKWSDALSLSTASVFLGSQLFFLLTPIQEIISFSFSSNTNTMLPPEYLCFLLSELILLLLYTQHRLLIYRALNGNAAIFYLRMCYSCEIGVGMEPFSRWQKKFWRSPTLTSFIQLCGLILIV